MRHKLSHEHNVEHNRSIISALHPIIIGKNYGITAGLQLEHNKIVYDELWLNCSSYGGNIEHNRQLF